MELKDHYIICGHGRMGSEIVDELHQKNIPFVIIDMSPGKSEVFENRGILHIIGDATTEEVLAEANIASAKAVLALLPSDADNLYLTIAA